MADQPDVWSCQDATYVSHPVVRCVLTALPRITTIFMRLPDGFIMDLWDGTAGSLSRIDDPATTYTHGELRAVLGAIIADVAPDRILTMDSINSADFDHPDHVASARFATEAAQDWGQIDTVDVYRGYSIMLSPPNLTQAEHDEKVRLMGLYGATVPPGSDYDAWCWRQYSSPLSIP